MKNGLIWVLVVWIVLSLITYVMRIDPVETDLNQRSTSATSVFNWLEISNEGREFVLTGMAPNEEDKQAAVDAVSKVYGVRTVQNAIEIEAKMAPPDNDQDGISDTDDPDDDNDGVSDTADAFPRNANEQLDSDGDGIGNNSDADDDGDGINDIDDSFPLDPTRPGAVDKSDVVVPVKTEEQLCREEFANQDLNLKIQFDSSEFLSADPANSTALKAFTAFATRCTSLSFSVVGHTDDRGEPDYNAQLSLRRANELKNLLVSMGISQERLDASGAGMTVPLASNESSQGRAENRRVEVDINN